MRRNTEKNKNLWHLSGRRDVKMSSIHEII